MRAGLGWLQERNRLRSVIPRYEDAVLQTVRKCAERWESGAEGDASDKNKRVQHESVASVEDKRSVILVNGRRYALVPGEDAIRSLSHPHNVLRDRRLAVLREPFFAAKRAQENAGGLKDELEQRMRCVSVCLSV